MGPLLVDTHVVLWWLADAPELSPVARELIADPESQPLVSAASVWELAIKSALGKLNAPASLLEEIEKSRFGWLPIEPRHAWSVGELPRHHGDPFDRLLIAQSLTEGVPLLTADREFFSYPIEVRW